MVLAATPSVSFARIRREARLIAERAAHVGVLTREVEDLARSCTATPAQPLPLGLAPEHALDFLLTRAALRFGSGYEPKLSLPAGTDAAAQLDAALVARFAARGPIPAREMANATREDVASLRGQGLVEPPQAEFVELQTRALRDLGRFLLDRHDGSAARLIESCCGSAARLVESLAVIPYFHDVQRYRGIDAHHYHRGQRFVIEIAATHAGQGLGRFDDLRDLAPSSDAACAQALRDAGVLVYDEALAQRVDQGEIVPAHSEREVEIRACTLHAAERLLAAVHARQPDATAVSVDAWLRARARGARTLPHRTRSVHY